MQAMILAAGLGTRLLPHTNIRPKPLFPILNKPLLLLTIERLKNFGFDHIIVNCHHLKEQIVEVLDETPGITVVEEEIILGTGGGLRGAQKFMRDEPILVSNGDIYHTIELGEFYQQHKDSGHKITMALHDFSRFNNVNLEGSRVVGFAKNAGYQSLAFTGVQVLNPEVLTPIESGKYSCIIDHYKALLADGQEIQSCRVDGCFWSDMGTVDDYLELHQGILTGEVPCWAEIEDVRKPYCISQKAKLPAYLQLNDWVSIGEAEVGNKSHIERSVIWDDVVVEGGQTILDAIISSNR